MSEAYGSATEAQVGDANSDLMSGTTLAFMVLTVLFIVVIVTLVAVLKIAIADAQKSKDAFQAAAVALTDAEDRRKSAESASAASSAQSEALRQKLRAAEEEAKALRDRQRNSEDPEVLRRVIRQLEKTLDDTSRERDNLSKTLSKTQLRIVQLENAVRASEGDEDGSLVNTGLRLSTFANSAIITDPEVQSTGSREFLNVKYRCTESPPGDRVYFGNSIFGGYRDAGALGQ